MVDTRRAAKDAAGRPFGQCDFDWGEQRLEQWDAGRFGYVPSAFLKVDQALQLHDEYAETVDPITHQVLRSRLWNLNLDAMDAVKRGSGTPQVVFCDDLNAAILTENGDTVVSGPGVQFFTGLSDLVVKWTLEHRSAGSGIEPGDVFIQNDPYIGACHQMDIAVYAPVFVDGALFCWVYTCAHVGDVGGTVPFSYCPGVPDIFWEPQLVPPMRIVRDGKLQPEVSDMFARMSRTPDLLMLQLRGQLAGVSVLGRGIQETVGQYEAATVKSVMRGMIDDCAVTVARRLASIPDGSWSETIYRGRLTPNDHDLLPISTAVQKVGDLLHFTNAGTAPQVASSSNCTFSIWRAGLISAVSMLLAYDQYSSPAGVARHIRLDIVPGSLTSAAHPAALTTYPSAVSAFELAGQVVSKMMLSGDDQIRKRALATGGCALAGSWTTAGVNERGDQVGGTTGDPIFGALGAFAGRDGVGTAGEWWWPRSSGGNVEEWESTLPIIYLYRKEKPDSGGAGRWRGGNCLETAVTPHRALGSLTTFVISSDPAVNVCPGLGGGHPGYVGDYLLSPGKNLGQVMKNGRIPENRSALVETLGPLRTLDCQSRLSFESGQVMVVDYGAGAGVGDPLDRDPRLVAVDLANGAVTAVATRTIFGVVIDDGTVDIDASERLRDTMRRDRLSGADVPLTPVHDTERQAHDYEIIGRYTLGVDLVRAGPHERAAACARCGRLLATTRGNYLDGCCTLSTDRVVPGPAVTTSDEPLAPDEDAIVFRRWLCPGCGTQLAAATVRERDPYPWDIRIDS